MHLDPQDVHRQLDRIDGLGWDSPEGRALLDVVRTTIVLPVVRASGLRGPAADQAACSAWAAAWDALRRPAARAAGNPAGMAWVAARRAVAAERAAGVGAGLPAHDPPDGPSGMGCAPGAPPESRGPVSLDLAVARGWDPASIAPAAPPGLGPHLRLVVAALAEVGWPEAVVVELVRSLGEAVGRDCTGRPTCRWRAVAVRLGVPHWQVRRVAELLVGGAGAAGLLELVVRDGAQVLRDPGIQAALRSTCRRWAPGPRAELARAAADRPAGDRGAAA
jgi:hypothetical protein